MYKKGTVIKRQLQGFWGLFFNHIGIYIGNDKVIHFTGTQKKERSAVISLDALERFACGYKVYVHREPNCPRHGENIAKTAKEVLQNKANMYNNKYSFVLKNCEDFVKYCYEAEY
ncbi:lecithin retinol acyltransferase family protein [Candidatus Uabimicrobium amorphum]|nr:lecithin retinol acyltransferase family protein [Candidatus Uabimicrobium amorphum]